MATLPSSNSSLSLQALATVGLLYLGFKVFSFVRLLLSLFVLPGVSLRKFGPKGSWAIITGASDGIGKEFSLQLASHGFNILLVSRTPSKLDALASEITSKYKNVQTKTLAMDFSQNSDVDYEKLKDIANEVGDIAVLVNNVGQSHAMPVPFLQTDTKEMLDIVAINCLGTLRVTQIIAPLMLQRRKPGLILTMASFGGILPTPLLATYSGSKAFLQQWSTALASELAPHGITVQLVQSYLVTSAMSKIRRASAMVPTPKTFVRSVLGKIGRSGGAQGVSATSTPYWAHGMMHWALATFVGTMNGFVVNRNREMHETIRMRALKKIEREKKA